MEIFSRSHYKQKIFVEKSLPDGGLKGEKSGSDLPLLFRASASPMRGYKLKQADVAEQAGVGFV